MKTRRYHFSTLQLVALAWLVCTGTALAQGERILWSKPDADPLLNVAFSNDGTILALGREDSNTADLLKARDGGSSARLPLHIIRSTMRFLPLTIGT